MARVAFKMSKNVKKFIELSIFRPPVPTIHMLNCVMKSCTSVKRLPFAIAANIHRLNTALRGILFYCTKEVPIQYKLLPN